MPYASGSVTVRNVKLSDTLVKLRLNYLMLVV